MRVLKEQTEGDVVEERFPTVPADFNFARGLFAVFPLRRDSHILGRHGFGNFPVPAHKGVALSCWVGRGGNIRSVVLRNGCDGTTACSVEGDRVLIDFPLCRDGHVFSGHGCGNCLIPADKGVTLFCRVGRCGDCRAIVLRDGCDFATACSVEGDCVLIDFPLRRDGHVFSGHGRGNRFVPADEGISFSCRIGRCGNRRAVVLCNGCDFAAAYSVKGYCVVVPPVCSDCRLSLISRVVSRDHGIFRSRIIVAAIRRGETIGGAGLRLAVDGHRLDAGGRLSRCSRVAHGEGVRAGISIDGILDGVALTVIQTLQHRRLRVRSHHMAAHSAELLLIAPVAGDVLSVLLGHFRGGVSCAAVLADPDVAVVLVCPDKFMATCAFLAAQLQLANYSAVIVGIRQAQPLQVHAPIFVGDKKLRCGVPVPVLLRFLVVAPLPPCRAQPHGLPVRGSDFDVLFYRHCKFLILHHYLVVHPVRASSDRRCRQRCIIGTRIKRKGQCSQRCVLD